jgi:hypothetical protein
MGFDVTDHLPIISFCIRQIVERKWEYNETVHQLFIDFKKACGSVRKEALYNILIKLRLFRLFKKCSNKNYIKVCKGKHLSDTSPTQNGLKQGDALWSSLFNFALEYADKRVHENQVGLKLWDTSASGLY